MSNTVTTTGPVITISDIGEDYDLGDYLPMHSIRFNAAGSDTCVIKNGDENGATIFKATCEADEDRIQYYHGQSLRPFLDYSAGSYSTDTEVTIILQRGMS